ncbi:MAG: hypothetical protein ACFFBP_11520 [Promethearchaeota archaeon]
MSELTDTKSNLKKIISVLEELQAINTDSIPKILESPNNLLNLVASYEEQKTANLNKKEANKDEINSLKNKIAQDERDIAKLEEENNELTKERQGLLDKIQTAQNELTDMNEKIKTKKEELETRTARLNELDDAVHEAIKEDKKFAERLQNLESILREELEKKENYLSSFGHRVASIKALIKMNYIKTQHLTLIKALIPGTQTEIKPLCIGIDLPEAKAKQILRDIVSEGGPIEFNEAAGTVLLKEEVGF